MADGAARVPPHNLDAEAAVLSAVMLDPTKDALDRARAILGSGEHFYADMNRHVWEAILDVDQGGGALDIVTVKERLAATGKIAAVGTDYILRLVDATPAVAHVEAHARIIVEKARQRRMVALAQRIAVEGYGNVDDVRAWSLDAAQAVADVASLGSRDDDPAERFDALVPRVIHEIDERARNGGSSNGIQTGWLRLNDVLGGGWERSQMHVIGGRPGMGKTSAVLCACLNVARQGLGVIFISAEMPKEQLAKRALAVESHTDVQAVMSGRLNATQWAAVTAGAARLAKLPLTIKFCPGAKIAEIRGTVRKEARRLPELGLVVVDYLQILDGERREGDSRESEVSNLSKRLVWMAQEFRVPVLAVSQLNRSVESRNNTNKRPSLSDLRESGAIEQDAYSVSLLYRDEYYNKGSEWAGVLEWIVAKQRNGPTGTVKLAFVAGSTMVANLAEDEQREFFDEGL